jgi:exonuclease VII small subunit
MWKKYDEGNQLDSAETVAAYEQAMKEFATSATQFLEHIELLTKARDAYQRAVTISAQFRGTLDKGDEILRNLMAQVDHAVSVQRSQDAPNESKPEATKVETNKATVEKAEAARA